MSLQILALLIIGTILLFIIGAFVFNSSFRKDVTAAKGEASVLGMFSVKGVLIILLCAIFCGTFVFILQYDKGGTSQSSNDSTKATPSINLKQPSGHVYNVVLDSTVSHEITLDIASKYTDTPINIGSTIEVDEMSGFYYRIDSVRYIANSKSKYQYFVSFGEKDRDGEIAWKKESKIVHKTENGDIVSPSQLIDVNDVTWKKQYKVLIGLGQPISSNEDQHIYTSVDMTKLIVVSAEIDVRKKE